ncbi:phage portal protein [Oenococcus oeni]|uniref:phage portal protein n=1 Tax=Oenococcus oeni TaxID=1247 RepID=UPI000510652F|nr:phage portal protein [Oenococcus oeni]KGH73692.1 portal protein [Oenococcus oeni IOEB_0502]
MPLFHSNFHIRDSTAKASIPIEGWTNIIDFLNPKEDHYVGSWKALRNPDIQAAIQLLAGDLATVELSADATRAQGILDNPSSTANARTFWITMFAQMILGGESFAYRWRNANGIDSHWEYLRPSQVQTFELSDGSGLVYNLSFDEPDIGLMQNVPQSDMIHLRYFSMNAMTGFSPLYSLATTLTIKQKADLLSKNALSQSATTSSALKIDTTNLNDTLAKGRAKVIGEQLNNSAGQPVVLAENETLTPLEIQSNLAQLLSQVDWTSTQIAKAFMIPDSYLNGQGDQQSSLDQISGLYGNTLNRDLQNVLSELNNKLNADITGDIRKAIDPSGDSYAVTLSTVAKNAGLASNQITYILQESGFIPDDLPDAKQNAQPIQLVQSVAADPPQEGENVDSTN